MAYTQAINKAVQRYSKKNYDTITIRVKKGKRESYNQLAEKRGVSFVKLITDYLDGEVEKDLQIKE